MPHFSDIGRLVQEETSLALAQALTGGEPQAPGGPGHGPYRGVHPGVLQKRTAERPHRCAPGGPGPDRPPGPVRGLRDRALPHGPPICGDDVTVDSILLLAAQKSGASGRVNDVLARAWTRTGREGPGSPAPKRRNPWKPSRRPGVSWPP